MVECGRCGLKVHSVACANFPSHRASQNMPFTCRQCIPPLLSLPLANPPPVANRIVIHQTADEALDNSLETFIPTSPIASSSPRHTSIQTGQPPQPPPPPPPPPPSIPPVTIATPTAPLTPPPLPFDIKSLFTQRIPTLRRVPRTAQREMADLKTSVWNSVLRNPENIDTWTLAFAHSKLTLFIPPGKKNFK